MCCGCLIAVMNCALLASTVSRIPPSCCYSSLAATTKWAKIVAVWVEVCWLPRLILNLCHTSLNSNCWFSSEWVLHCDVWKPFGISCFADSFILKFFLKRVILLTPWFSRCLTPISFLYPNSTCRFDIRSPVLFSLFIGKQCGTNLLLFMEADTLRHALITFFFFFSRRTWFNFTNQRYINLILKEKDEEKIKAFVEFRTHCSWFLCTVFIKWKNMTWQLVSIHQFNWNNWNSSITIEIIPVTPSDQIKIKEKSE